MQKLYTLLWLMPLLLLGEVVTAQPSITYSATVSGLTAPVEVTNAADGTNRLFIVQQNGIVRVYDPAAGGLQAAPFLNVSSLITYSGERGLLSIAFHPAYETNGYFFVYYNNISGDITVARYHATGTANVADAGGVVLLDIPKPFDNHNGGHLQFARDTTLYFATGDGGSANDPGNRSQDSTSLLGKMLRLRVDNFTTPPYYTVPANNPLKPNWDSRIWARGLRNPYRWSFDRLTGDMWIGDVGQGAKEEVDFRPGSSAGGENYGWRCYEGSIRTPGVTACDPPDYFPPIFDYDNPSNGSSSVVGGYVYRGAEYGFFQGYYIAADVYSGTVYLIKQNGASFAVTPRTGLQNFVVGFGEGEDGTIYAVSQGTGIVYKVVPSVTLPVSFTNFSGRATSGGNELAWSTASETGVTKFVIEYSSDGTAFSAIGERPTANANGRNYSFTHAGVGAAVAYYRLQIIEQSGGNRYSSIIKLNSRQGGYVINPTIIRNGALFITATTAVDRVQVVNSNGVLVFQQLLLSAAGQFQVQLPPLPKGVYLVRLTGATAFTSKVVIE